MIGLLCAFSLTTRAAEVRIAETEKAPADETASQDATKKKVSVTVFQNGQPLPGAIVLISGSNVGTVTGKEGTAQISAAPGNELVISYVGCQTRKVRVSDKSGAESFEITLETESNKLDPVSVTPGDQKTPRPKAPQSRKGAESQTALYRRRRRADEHRRDRPQYDRTDQRPQKSVLHRSVRFAG